MEVPSSARPDAIGRAKYKLRQAELALSYLRQVPEQIASDLRRGVHLRKMTDKSLIEHPSVKYSRYVLDADGLAGIGAAISHGFLVQVCCHILSCVKNCGRSCPKVRIRFRFGRVTNQCMYFTLPLEPASANFTSTNCSLMLCHRLPLCRFVIKRYMPTPAKGRPFI
jgi:hypothetical protein